ncbi:unnamed protein product [Arctia plantaginis]|uniref:Uncharacterized protein n=1 Tax=Arctia plantaginis TaxID=874455 RepID=A0A8S1AWS4_ARCPL|nr:unnamed protein product [Arctia plantaginis]
MFIENLFCALYSNRICPSADILKVHLVVSVRAWYHIFNCILINLFQNVQDRNQRFWPHWPSRSPSCH